MSQNRGYRVESFGTNRQLVVAASTVNREKNTIHLPTEVDITEPRRLIAAHRERTGERLSLMGMFGSGPMWVVPLTNATVTVAVEAIARRLALVDGSLQEREHLCLAVSFDHDIVDGAPAARFTSRFAELLSSGDEVRELMRDARAEPSDEVADRAAGEEA